MSVGEAEFSVHLQGTKQLRQSRKRWRLVSKATRQLNQISAFLCLLARTTSFQKPAVPWTDSCIEEMDDDFGLESRPGSCYEYMYGITPGLAACIQETCRLGEYLSLYDVGSEDIPDTLLLACEALGNRLLSWTFESEDVYSTVTPDEVTRDIFESHAKAWQTAALIFYSRRIQHCCTKDVSRQAACVAEHMHAVEDAKARLGSKHTGQMAPITWPAFIASCESTDRETWREWWQRVQHYGIANIQMQWGIVQHVWQRCDENHLLGLEDVSWVDVVREMNVSILPI